MAGPNIAGFLLFIRNVMGINSTILPDNSPSIPMALAVSQAIVNPALNAVAVPAQPPGSGTQTTIYNLAVYYLAADNLINYAQDLPGAAPVDGSEPPTPFFAWTRRQLNINGFVSGVISASNDETTGQTMVVQDAAKNFTIANLQQLKTIYGRQYLAWAQSYGPSTWGLT
jgi:hypothetical protein